MRSRCVLAAVLGGFIASALLLAGCGAGGTAGETLVEKAAREATAIVEQAQATALMLQAQAQATAVMSQAEVLVSKPVPEATWMAYVPESEVGEEEDVESAAEPTQPTGDTVQVISVGFAGEGGFIMVRFLAPPEVSELWWQGAVSVQEEESGTLYNEIPVIPKIGLLIGRPQVEGQIGYVMLVNTFPGLQSGTLVTVTLGNYQFEHIPVQ